MFSYKPLFRLLLERDISKTELGEKLGFGSKTVAKFAKNEYVSMKTLDDICKFLDCKIEDIIEHQP